jgi:hypothetical protein
MSNSYDEIKKLLKASSNLLDTKKDLQLKEDIKKSYGMLSEQDNITTRINPLEDAEAEIENEKKSKDDKQQSYRISGALLTLHGKDKTDLELTTDEKSAFQETIDEFTEQVSDLVDFEVMNIFKTDVEWGGKIIDYDIDFYFTIGETNGIYINGTMIKVDSDFLEMINKLQDYYEKFKTKWAKILAQRKLTSK